MRVLYVTTVGITMRFFDAFIRQLLNEGHTVDIATNEQEFHVPECYREWGCKIYPITTSRSPLNKGNLSAIKQIKQLVSENGYDIVHCHTPMAGVCTRLACRKFRKQGGKVFYTAHGFHFYKGAPIKNWLLYYPAEKLCSYFTDVLITINQEDFALAQKKMKAKCVKYVPGVGIDVEKYRQPTVDKQAKRKELGIPEDAFVLLSVGELNENKNHETVIRASADLDVYYIIAGTGNLNPHLQNLIDTLGISNRVKLLGYHDDVKDLYGAADAFVFPSFREGLSVSLMEAMASGLPCIVSNIRGNVDLIHNGANGFLCDPFDASSFEVCIDSINKDELLLEKLSERNKEIIQKFDFMTVAHALREIYKGIMPE